MTPDDAIEIGLPQTSTRDAEVTRAALEQWLAAIHVARDQRKP